MILNVNPKTSTIDGQIDGFSLYSRFFLCGSILYVHLNWNRRIRERSFLGSITRTIKRSSKSWCSWIDFVKCYPRSSLCNSGPYAELYNLNVKCIFWMKLQDRELFEIWRLFLVQNQFIDNSVLPQSYLFDCFTIPLCFDKMPLILKAYLNECRVWSESNMKSFGFLQSYRIRIFVSKFPRKLANYQNLLEKKSMKLYLNILHSIES